jgi:phosphatidylserine decarboxylase
VVIAERWLEGRSLPWDGVLAVGGLACLPGEDLGTFQFGSTVVLLLGGPMAANWRPCAGLGPVRVGQRLGSFGPAPEA